MQSKLNEFVSKTDDFKQQFPAFKEAQFPQDFIRTIEEHFKDNKSFISESAIISKHAVIEGNNYIGDNVIIRPFAYIRGNVIILNDTVIGQSVELKNSIIFDHCEIPHLSYVGDSILGSFSHLGAGAVISNVRLDKKNVRIQKNDSGLQKFGAVLGDEAQIGCNAVVNPGSILKQGSFVMPCTSFSGVLEKCKNNKATQ